MKRGVVLVILILIGFMSGCVDVPQERAPEPTPEPVPLTDLEKLELFLEEDRTDELEYDAKGLSGLNYLPGAVYARTLAENALRVDIHMGAIVPRQSMGVGKLTVFQDPYNYIIIGEEIIIINPQNDQIMRLDGLLHENNDNRYLTLFPDAQMATDFGQRTYPIDVDLGGEYNEAHLAKAYRPL